MVAPNGWADDNVVEVEIDHPDPAEDPWVVRGASGWPQAPGQPFTQRVELGLGVGPLQVEMDNQEVIEEAIAAWNAQYDMACGEEPGGDDTGGEDGGGDEETGEEGADEGADGGEDGDAEETGSEGTDGGMPGQQEPDADPKGCACAVGSDTPIAHGLWMLGLLGLRRRRS